MGEARALSSVNLYNCCQIHWTRLLTNSTGRAEERSLVGLRAKNQLNTSEKFRSLLLVWLVSTCLSPFLCSRSNVGGCILWLAGCWRRLWPQITQYESSVHKISSRVLCIRRQGKMSHSAELRGERWNGTNWNRTSIPLHF